MSSWVELAADLLDNSGTYSAAASNFRIMRVLMASYAVFSFAPASVQKLRHLSHNSIGEGGAFPQPGEIYWCAANTCVLDSRYYEIAGVGFAAAARRLRNPYSGLLVACEIMVVKARSNPLL